MAGAFVVCIAAYAYRYNLMSSQAPSRGSVFSTLAHFRPDYSIAFIGNAAAIAGSSLISVWMCLTLGSRSPAVFRLAGMARIFPQKRGRFLFSAFSASYRGWRGGAAFRLWADAKRIFAVRHLRRATRDSGVDCRDGGFLRHKSEPLLNNGPYLAMTMATVLFALWMDEIGYLKLAGREVDAVKWMEAFEHPGSPGSSEGPMAEYPQQSAATVASRLEARVILKESMQLGVYEPPKF